MTEGKDTGFTIFLNLVKRKSMFLANSSDGKRKLAIQYFALYTAIQCDGLHFNSIVALLKGLFLELDGGAI